MQIYGAQLLHIVLGAER